MKVLVVASFLFSLLMGLLFAAEPANVILITVDTLRADRLEAYGYQLGRTPASTALAQQGVLFENVVVQTPITLPSHTSILTGTYPFYHRVQDSVAKLREDIPTLAEWFKTKGYVTGAVLGAVVLLADYGLNRGFDLYDDNFPFPAVHPRDSSSPPERPSLTNQLVSLVERPAETVINLALTWLETNRRSPFFLWVHLYDSHDPYSPPDPFETEFGDRPYDGEIAYLENQLARFFQQLREWGLYDNSLIVYTSDHGESLGEHEEAYHAYYLYDASLRVPLIFKSPSTLAKDRIQRGSRVSNQVRSVDIAPTIIQLLGDRVPTEMQGEGLVGMMTGKRPNLQLPAYAETHYPQIHFGWSSLFSYSTPTHKYIEAPIPELYDLRKDPGELTNIFEKQTGLAHQMRVQMHELQRRFIPKNQQIVGEKMEADAETIERLSALGYVAFSAGRGDSMSDQSLPDPKLKIGSYARMNRALEVSRQGDTETAIAIYRSVIQDEPESPTTHFMLASQYFSARLFLKAVEHFQETIRLQPEQVGAQLNLARSYSNAGLSSKAEDVVRELLTQDPMNYGARHLLANLLARRGNYMEALREELAVLEIRPYYLPALNNLGSYYLETGDFVRSIEAYRRGLDVAPSVVLLRNNLTLAYLKARSYGEALNEARLVTQISPEDGLAHYYLAQAYAGSGMAEEARSSFRRAKELEPRLSIPSL